MRAPGYKAPAPGLRHDGMPNRAWRRSHTQDQVVALTMSVFQGWMRAAALLLTGPLEEVTDDAGAGAEEAAA